MIAKARRGFHFGRCVLASTSNPAALYQLRRSIGPRRACILPAAGEMMNPTAGERKMLCHFLAALAYRTQKAVRGASPDFPRFRAAPAVRTPHELINHMTSVLGYATTFF